MKAKRSIVLLSGLLLLMIVAAWAQMPETLSPTCPASGEDLNSNGQITRWVRANLNVNAKQWEIDCSSLSIPANAANAITNAAVPARGRGRANANAVYYNANGYTSPPDANIYTGPYSNVNAQPANKPRRRPNK